MKNQLGISSKKNKICILESLIQTPQLLSEWAVDQRYLAIIAASFVQPITYLGDQVVTPTARNT